MGTNETSALQCILITQKKLFELLLVQFGMLILNHYSPNRTTLLKNTICISRPLLWNALDPTIKESATVDKFKRSLKTQLLGAGLLWMITFGLIISLLYVYCRPICVNIVFYETSIVVFCSSFIVLCNVCYRNRLTCKKGPSFGFFRNLIWSTYCYLVIIWLISMLYYMLYCSLLFCYMLYELSFK